jgi:hypothetical protein
MNDENDVAVRIAKAQKGFLHIIQLYEGLLYPEKEQLLPPATTTTANKNITGKMKQTGSNTPTRANQKSRAVTMSNIKSRQKKVCREKGVARGKRAGKEIPDAGIARSRPRRMCLTSRDLAKNDMIGASGSSDNDEDDHSGDSHFSEKDATSESDVSELKIIKKRGGRKKAVKKGATSLSKKSDCYDSDLSARCYKETKSRKMMRPSYKNNITNPNNAVISTNPSLIHAIKDCDMLEESRKIGYSGKASNDTKNSAPNGMKQLDLATSGEDNHSKGSTNGPTSPATKPCDTNMSPDRVLASLADGTVNTSTQSVLCDIMHDIVTPTVEQATALNDNAIGCGADVDQQKTTLPNEEEENETTAVSTLYSKYRVKWPEHREQHK